MRRWNYELAMGIMCIATASRVSREGRTWSDVLYICETKLCFVIFSTAFEFNWMAVKLVQDVDYSLVQKMRL